MSEQLQADRDYPGSPESFDEWFADEDRALEWVAGLRWADGFTCPRCGHHEFWEPQPGQYRCKNCRHRVAALAGTPFNRSRIPITKILTAAWMLTWNPEGTNGKALAAELGIKYENAWTILHKFRQVMLAAMEEVQLSGVIVAGPTFGPHGRYCILLMKEKRSSGSLRLASIESTAPKYLLPAMEAAIPAPATIQTTDDPGFKSLKRAGYLQEIVGPETKAMVALISIAADLETWFEQQVRRTPDEHHLPYYLAEYAYRYNQREVSNRGEIFYTLMQETLQQPELTQAEIVQR